MTCQHCHMYSITRPRRLCWRCYYTLAIRDLYQPTSKFASRGLAGDNKINVDPPAAPTDARPGTVEKIAALCERALAGVALWHPLDFAAGDD